MTNAQEFRLVAQLELHVAGVTLPINDEQAAYRHLSQRAASIGRPVIVAVEDSPSYGIAVDAASNVAAVPVPDEPDAKIKAKRWSLVYENAELSGGRTLPPLLRTAESMATRLGGDIKIIGFAGPHTPAEPPHLSQSAKVDQSLGPNGAETSNGALHSAATVRMGREEESTLRTGPTAFYGAAGADPRNYGEVPEPYTAWAHPPHQKPDSTVSAPLHPTAPYGTPAGYAEVEAVNPLPRPGEEPLVNAWARTPYADSTHAPQPNMAYNEPRTYHSDFSNVLLGRLPPPDPAPEHTLPGLIPGGEKATFPRWGLPLPSMRSLIAVATIIFLATAALIFGLLINPSTGTLSSNAESTSIPVVEGYSAAPSGVFDPHNGAYAIAEDQQHLAMLTNGRTLRIQPVTASVDDEVVGDKGMTMELAEGQTFSTDIRPLGNSGFAVIAQTSQSIGSSPTLLTWTPRDGTKQYKLKPGDTLASRGGAIWITSKINAGTFAPRLVTPTKIVDFSTPGSGPALLGFASYTQAIWASIGRDSTPQLVLADVKGKTISLSTIAGPKQGYTVARWVAANGRNALILWKFGETFTLALHDTSTGKLMDSMPFSLPPGIQQPAEIPVSTSVDGETASFGNTAVNFNDGKFIALEGSPPAKGLTVAPGGYQLTLTDGTAIFLRRDGSKAPLPSQGDLVALSEDAALTKSSKTLTVYPSTDSKE